MFLPKAEVIRTPNFDQMTIRCVRKVFFARPALVVDDGPLPDPVQRIVGQSDDQHLFPAESEGNLTDPSVSVDLNGLVVVVLVVAVAQHRLVDRQPADAEVSEGLDFASRRVVVDVERFLGVGAADGRDRRRRSAVAVVLVPEDGVVEVRGTRARETDFLLLGEASVVLVPRSHVEVVAAPRHDGLQKSGGLVVVELHLGLASSDSSEAAAGVVVAVRHLEVGKETL